MHHCCFHCFDFFICFIAVFVENPRKNRSSKFRSRTFCPPALLCLHPPPLATRPRMALLCMCTVTRPSRAVESLEAGLFRHDRSQPALPQWSCAQHYRCTCSAVPTTLTCRNPHLDTAQLLQGVRQDHSLPGGLYKHLQPTLGQLSSQH